MVWVGGCGVAGRGVGLVGMVGIPRRMGPEGLGPPAPTVSRVEVDAAVGRNYKKTQKLTQHILIATLGAEKGPP